METFFSAIFDIFLYGFGILSIIISIFYFIKQAKLILLNSFMVICTAVPFYLHYHNLAGSFDLFPISRIALLFFPITYTLLIKNHFSKVRIKTIWPIAIASILSLLMHFFLPGAGDIIIFLVHVFLNVYIVILIFPQKRNIEAIILTIFLTADIIYLFTAVILFDLTHFSLSLCTITLITFVIISFNIRFRILRLLNQFNNITELNKKLTHTIARLKQSNDQCKKIIVEKDLELFQMARHASLAELTTGIAHELSQPLTGIKGIAQNMVDDINFEEFDNLQAVSELMKICSLVDKSSSIIDHIRKFSRKSFMSLKAVDLNKIILDAIDLINLQLKKTNIDLIFVLDDNIPKIVGDRISLEQLILNIILNSKDAILEKKFSDEGHGGEIRITTSHVNGSVKLIIEDNGTGISDDIMQKIWSPFFTTKKRGNGTGIGLSICNKIIRDHNASVEIKSSDDGTYFTITFQVVNGQ